MAEWLRSTRIGLCEGHSVRSDGVDVGEGDCEAGSEGVWQLTAATNTWPRMAEACLERCARCARCHHLSMSFGLEQCRWFRRCSVLLLNNADLRSPSPIRPWLFRSASVEGGRQFARVHWLKQRHGSSAVLAANFLHKADIGTCGRVSWNSIGDCEAGVAGAFKVGRAKKKPKRVRAPLANQTCATEIPMARALSECVFVSAV